MLDPAHPIVQLVRKDPRYSIQAYVFVFEALRYAQEHLGFGSEAQADDEESTEVSGRPRAAAQGRKKPARGAPDARPGEQHLTGQELCEAMRLYALDQYGYMAKCVLNQWGVRTTGDFGEIVYNLIGIGQMRKTPHDRREHFEKVFDFDEALHKGFRFGQSSK